jgi:hypothetical protein
MEPSSGRGRNGKFTKGNRIGRQWRPGESGNKGGMSFSVTCQYLLEKYELVEEVAMIAAGFGRYKKVAISDRLRAFELLTDRGHGKPRQALELDAAISDQPKYQVIKRLILDGRVVDKPFEGEL